MTPMNMNKLNNRQCGFSLIELMTAMVISILLLTAAVGMFITNNRIYREQNEMGQLQENARFAMSLIIKDIRSVAFVGCADDITKVTNNLTNVTDLTLNSFSVSATSDLIEGSENGANWQPSTSTSAVANMITTTDAIPSDGITVRRLETTGVEVTTAMGAVNDPLTTAVGNGFAQGDYLVVSDCGGADIFRVTNADANTTGTVKHVAGAHNTTSNFSRVYSTTASIYTLVNRRYFIRNSATGSGAALWRESLAGMEELVEGVESMQVLYGEDTNTDFIADAYVNAANVTSWSNVISVKIGLLMRTVAQFGDGTGLDTYTLLGTDVGPVDDSYRRRIFTSTIEIRNRKS